MPISRPILRPLTSPLTRAVTDGGGGFYPASLFAAGEQGAWYDPSDLSTLFQDAAGTTPVTAVEQPVGKMLDKSGNGNHATQATAAARPVLSARKNLLVNSQFGGGGAAPTSWSQPFASGTSVINGTIDGNTIYRHTAVTQRPCFSQLSSQTLGTSGSLTGSAYVDTLHSGALVAIQFIAWSTLPAASTVAYYINGVLDGSGGSALVSSGDRVSVVITSGGTAGTPTLRVGAGCSSNITADVSFSRPQIELGSIATRYQRVNTATDYDTVGFPVYRKYDGVDDVENTTFGSSLGAACTVARSLPVTGASILTGQTIGTSFADSTTGHALVIINRALNATETTNLTRWLNQKAGL